MNPHLHRLTTEVTQNITINYNKHTITLSRLIDTPLTISW